MRQIAMQDSFGLRTLDERGDVAFESYDGEHVAFSDAFYRYLIRKYLMKEWTQNKYEYFEDCNHIFKKALI